jgi:hypothetical protein
MRWSQLKVRIEAGFAERVKGRVKIFVTRYHRAHDGAGEAWVTIDGERIACMSEIAYWKHRVTLQRRLEREETGLERLDYSSLEHRQISWRTGDCAAAMTSEAEIYSDDQFKQALFTYLNLSIDAVLASPDPIIRGFGLLDMRCGKGRLASVDVNEETEFVRRLYAFRCGVDGIRPKKAQSV